MIVLQREIFESLYRLAGNMQTNEGTRRAYTSNSSERQRARRMHVMFAFLAKGGNDLGRSS